MQTFTPLPTPEESAKALDYRRLGKQRVEAIQIANTLLGYSTGWRHHPVVKKWAGFEHYLVTHYLKAMMDEWTNRGYRNDKCLEHYNFLKTAVEDLSPKKPDWWTEETCAQHRGILYNKDSGFYASWGSSS